MNKVMLSGRLTREPDVRYSQTGEGSMAVARFTLAVNRKRSREGEQAADFINCVAFGKSAEFAEKYLHQGTKIIVEGRWQTGSYTNKEGNKVYTNDCMVEGMEFAESKGSSESGTSSRPAPGHDMPDFMNIPDDVADEGLPFN